MQTQTTILSKMTSTQVQTLINSQSHVQISIPFGKTKTVSLSDFFANDVAMKVKFYDSLSKQALNLHSISIDKTMEKKYKELISKQYRNTMLNDVYNNFELDSTSFRKFMKWTSINKNKFINSIVESIKTECDKDAIKKGWVQGYVKTLHINTVSAFLQKNK